MTNFESLVPSHVGHKRHDPRYEAMLAKHTEAAAPVLAALRDHGWSNVTLDPYIDCEVPSRPDAIDLWADVPAGQLGTLPISARVVLHRPATLVDSCQTFGHPHNLDIMLSVVVADELDAQAREYVNRGRIIHLTLDEAGLGDL